MDLSVSRIKKYLNCPLSYKLEYIDKCEKDFIPAAMAFGSAVHETLERFHSEKVSLDKLKESFKLSWDAFLDETPPLRYNRLKHRELEDRGLVLIEKYYEKFRELEFEDVELYFETPIVVGGEYNGNHFHGRIDLTADSSVYEIKTSSRSYSQKKAESSLQLTAYSYAYEMLYGKSPKELVLVVLVKTKTPKIQVLKTKRTDRDYTMLQRTANSVADAVEKEVFPPNPLNIYGCDSCMYKSSCKE